MQKQTFNDDVIIWLIANAIDVREFESKASRFIISIGDQPCIDGIIADENL